jgi:alpha-tubulin suppressor-like RCC1 family protein
MTRADGTFSRSKVPRWIKIDDEVSAISCGGHHSMALTKDRELLGWGSNYFGQLGLGFRRRTKVPKRVDVNGVYSIACGEFHSMALSLDGKLYGWGNNENGQLGNGSDAHIHKPHGQVSRLIHVPNDGTHHVSAGSSLANSGKKLGEKMLL